MSWLWTPVWFPTHREWFPSLQNETNMLNLDVSFVFFFFCVWVDAWFGVGDSLGLLGLGEAISHSNKNDEPPSEPLCLPPWTSPEEMKSFRQIETDFSVQPFLCYRRSPVQCSWMFRRWEIEQATYLFIPSHTAVIILSAANTRQRRGRHNKNSGKEAVRPSLGAKPVILHLKWSWKCSQVVVHWDHPAPCHWYDEALQ